MIVQPLRFVGVLLLLLTTGICGQAQKDNLALFGNVNIRVKGTGEPATPPVATIILFSPSGPELARPTGPEIGRQNIINGGSYRFSDLRPGEYELAIEIEQQEVSRTRVILTSLMAPFGLQHDITLEWRPPSDSTKSMTISADVHERSAPNKRLFKKAEEAVAEKKYDQATSLLRQIIASDKADYQAQTILGTLLASQGRLDEAEQAYLSALSTRPNFPQALLDFGRLRLKQKRFADAIEPLTRLVGLQPDSGEANLLLSDAYVQANMLSKAIPHLNSAAALGYPEAHLRLAWIYDAVGSKDKAAREYEEFLKKKPDYPDRQKLAGYIKANKKN